MARLRTPGTLRCIMSSEPGIDAGRVPRADADELLDGAAAAAAAAAVCASEAAPLHVRALVGAPAAGLGTAACVPPRDEGGGAGAGAAAGMAAAALGDPTVAGGTRRPSCRARDVSSAAVPLEL